MKKTPLQLILAIAISTIVAGVAVAMIFGGTDMVSEIKELLQKDNTKVTNTVETDDKISD